MEMKNNGMRCLSLLLALVLVIGLMPVSHAHAQEEVFLVLGGQASAVEENGVYVICLHGTQNALTNRQGANSWGTHTLATAACGTTVGEESLWTLEAAEGGYRMKNVNGYLAVSRNAAELNETGHVFELVYHGDSGWAIKSLDSNEYFNNLGGSGSIGGWSGDGTKFDLYTLVETPADVVDPYGKLRGQWSKVSVDTETIYDANEGKFEYAFDNNLGSIWHSNWQGASDKLTGENTFAGVIDFGKAYTINRFSFTPRQGGNLSGVVTQASLFVKASEDAEWVAAAEHVTFDVNRDKKDIDFPEQEVRFVKFVAEQSNDGWVAVSEFDIDYIESAHEHDYASVVTASTCTEDGYTTYSCDCGDSYTEVIPATGHAWDNDLDTDCNNGCGYTREVEVVTSEKIEGITGQGSSVDTSEPAYDKSVGNAFDGNTDTFWATVPGGSLSDAYLLIDLGGVYPVNKVEYTKRYDAGAKYNCTGNLLDYIIEVSTDDGVSWEQVAAGETVDGTTVIEFEPVMASQIRLTATRSYHWNAAQANTVMTVAELAVYKNVVVGCEHPDTDVFCWTEVPPTCTEGGSYALISCCAVCGGEVSREYHILEPNGHAEVTIPGREPTCTEPGLTEGKECCVCLEQIVEQEELPALGHAVVTVSGREPTCTEPGLTEGKQCCVCLVWVVLPQEIPSLGHSYEAVVTAPDCENGGYTTYTCTACGDSYVADETEALGHDFEAQVFEPTCTGLGFTHYTCTVCGFAYDGDEVPATGHTEQILPAVPANCTSTGLTEGCVCAVCGYVIAAQEIIPATEHPYEAVVTAPTCTEAGYTTYTCSVCGDSYIADPVDPLGHTEEVIPGKEATCTETGLTEGKKCSVCGEIITAQEEIPALGHSYENGSCVNCGEADPNAVTVLAEGWSGYTTWVLTSDGCLTFTSSGETLPNGESNLKNYWKVGGVLTLPWGDYAEQITRVVINEGIHDIGEMAFYALPNLTEVRLPSTIVEIRGYAFKNCTSLTTINLEGVDFIREGAFYGCAALEQVTFLEGVVIEDWAFTRTQVQLP